MIFDNLFKFTISIHAPRVGSDPCPISCHTM